MVLSFHLCRHFSYSSIFLLARARATDCNNAYTEDTEVLCLAGVDVISFL